MRQSSLYPLPRLFGNGLTSISYAPVAFRRTPDVFDPIDPLAASNHQFDDALGPIPTSYPVGAYSGMPNVAEGEFPPYAFPDGRNDIESESSLSYHGPTPAGQRPTSGNAQTAAVGDLRCDGFSAGCQMGGSRGTTATHRVSGRNLCTSCAIKMLGFEELPSVERVKSLAPYILRGRE